MIHSAEEIEAARYKTLRNYVLFVGCQRSGHNLVAQLIDAHPDAIVAYNLSPLDLIEQGVERVPFFKQLLVDARDHIIEQKRLGDQGKWIRDSWQGRHRFIRTIGGPRGTLTASKIAKKPEVLDRLEEVVELPLRVIHVIRNPYDNAAALNLNNYMPLQQAAQICITGIKAVQKVREEFDSEEILEVKYEHLLSRPRDTLQRVCRLLRLEPEAEYLETCEKYIEKPSKRRRDQVQWDPVSRVLIQRAIAETPAWADYTFEK